MTEEQQRIAIAEACGWKDNRSGREWRSNWIDPNGEGQESIPNYLTDFNAMAGARKALTDKEKAVFAETLAWLVGNSTDPHYGASCWSWLGVFNIIDASANKQAEAFLRAKNLWTE